MVLLRDFRQDMGYALRMLGRNPGFAVVAVLTIALGIGINTTLFSIYNSGALKPLPVSEPGQVSASQALVYERRVRRYSVLLFIPGVRSPSRSQWSLCKRTLRAVRRRRFWAPYRARRKNCKASWFPRIILLYSECRQKSDVRSMSMQTVHWEQVLLPY